MENLKTDAAAPIREGEQLDTKALEAYLHRHLPDFSGNIEMGQFPSGYSNLTYLLKIGGRGLVLRRPPFGVNIKSGHDMGREFRILSALSEHYAKVPQPYLYCEDESVLGAPFYVMERVEGAILRPKMPPGSRPSKEMMGVVATGLVDTFVELHNLDCHAIGLGDLGKPDGYVERQIVGWTKRYHKAKTDEIPPLEKAAEWLHAKMPPESGSALIHNDYKYDNLVLKEETGEVLAVLDWEMSTLGDPLMDLGTSLGYWVNQGDPDWLHRLALSPTTLPGNPTRGELVQQYAAKSGRDVGNVVFYYVYGIFKVAVIAQQIYYRYKAGHTKDPRFAGLIDAVKGLGALANQAISKKRIDGLF